MKVNCKDEDRVETHLPQATVAGVMFIIRRKAKEPARMQREEKRSATEE